MSEELNFDSLEVIEVPVSVKGKKYILREASGDAAIRYRNAMSRCFKFGPDGKPTEARDMADTEPVLVAFCLWDEQGKHPTVDEVRSWPHKVLKALFKKAVEISELNEDEGKASVKNEQSASQAGSD